MTGPDEATELFHGYTYSGHPSACAVALASLDILQNEGLVALSPPFIVDELQIGEIVSILGKALHRVFAFN